MIPDLAAEDPGPAPQTGPPPPDGPRTEWPSLTHRFSLSGHEAFVTAVTDDEGRVVGVDLRMAKAGGTLRGFAACLAESISLGLRAGIPLAHYIDLLSHQRFEPSGHTAMGYAESPADYLARWLAARFPDPADAEPAAPPAPAEQEVCAHCGEPATWAPGGVCPTCHNAFPPERRIGEEPA